MLFLPRFIDEKLIKLERLSLDLTKKILLLIFFPSLLHFLYRLCLKLYSHLRN